MTRRWMMTALEFACVADDDFLYIAFRVMDDIMVTGESTGCEVWTDDSLEIYLDGCFERASTYDVDDAQIVVGAETIGVTDQAQIALGGCHTFGSESGTLVRTVATADGWAGELAIPLDPEGDAGWAIERADGQVIGFNTHYNDDDDGGERDHKLIWGLTDRNTDGSWNNPQMFGELQLCSILEPDTETENNLDGGVDSGEDAAPDIEGIDLDSGTAVDTVPEAGGDAAPAS